jgi:hypothetical protein
MTEHRSHHRRDARAPDRGPDPGLSRAMVMAAVTDVALFLPVGWNKGQPREQCRPSVRD